jgi:hypothetical protein
MKDWLSVEIQDENGVTLYRPDSKDKKSDKHILKPPKDSSMRKQRLSSKFGIPS